MRNWTRVLLTVLVTGGLVVPPTIARSTADAPPDRSVRQVQDGLQTGPRVARTWSPTYMADHHHYSRDQALAVARRFDLVVAMPVAFAQHLPAMRAENPRLRVLAYSNAMLASRATVRGLPESAFAHDRWGRRIMSGRWDTFLMEPSSPDWRRAAVRQCRHRASSSGYDGCLVDMLTLGIFSRGLVATLPVVPGTAKVYSQRGYRRQLVELGNRYESLLPRLELVANAVENGYRYWAAPVTSRPLARRMPGAQMEDFLRGAYDPVGDLPTGVDWRRDLRVVRDLERRDRVGLFTTKLWVGASRAQVAQWQAYAMATFLLAAQGGSYFAFTDARTQAGATGSRLPYRMPRRLGPALDHAERLDNGVVLRRFGHGLAVANPTRHRAVLDLRRAHRTLAGNDVRRVVLPPASGADLVRR
jgi:hypothetical protein